MNRKLKLALIALASTIVVAVPFTSPKYAEATAYFPVDTGGTLTTNLVSYYKFASNANDSWGTNNLTVSGPAYSASGPASASGNSYDWTSSPGANDVISGTFGSAIGTTYSVNFWVYYTGGTSNAYIIDWGGNNNQVQIYFGVERFDGGTNGPTSIGTTGWHMITVTKNGAGSTCKAYLDTSTQISGGCNNDTPTTAFSIGNYGGGGGYPMYGKMAEVGVWNKVLSSQEITDLYNSGNGETLVTVSTYPSISLSPSSLSISAYNTSSTAKESTSSRSFVLTNVGDGAMSWTGTTTQTWLALSASTGSLSSAASTSLSVNVNSGVLGFVAGTYNATATISDSNATNSPQSVGVTLTISYPGVTGSCVAGANYWTLQ